ncbi:MAG: hypothetical protein ACUVT5_01640 [Candidatus Bathyarchaeales archaeon]
MKHRRGNKALSPVVSTVVITGTIIMLVTVVLVFANNFLSIKMAESDFNAAKQFMQTVGLQVDDVAWIIGRAETARFSSRYGQVILHQLALNYTIYVNTTTPNVKFFTAKTGIICFNMPTSQYSVGNNYFELIYPSSNSFLLSGASAPVARVFTVEKIPTFDGSYVRVVVVPIIRMVNLTIDQANYVRLYLPILSKGDATSKNYPTVTLTGESFHIQRKENVTGIKIVVSFPFVDFDNSFFNFAQEVELIRLTGSSILDINVGGVDVDLGAHP